MDLELDGKAAIVTGGSKGIGKAIALELAREGVDVAICARGREALEETAHELEQETGRRILPIVADTADRQSVEGLVETAVQSLGKVDILVNNAALPGGLVVGPLEEASEDDLLDDINTKVVGYLRCAKAVAPHLERRGWGRIVNIGGLAARQAGTISGLRNAALVHLTKTLSIQLGPSGITVNLVHPGATRTERTDPSLREEARRQETTVDEVETRMAEETAIRRVPDARDIAYVVAFLASSRAGAVTGEVIAAGGGRGTAVFQ